MNPLIADVIAQRGKARTFAVKVCLLLALLFVCDRAVDAVLHRGLMRYFGLDRPATVVCIGHSRTVLGVNSDILEESLGVPVAKYAVQGANNQDRFAMLRHVLAGHPGSTKLVIFDVSAFTFNDRGLSSNSYRLFYPFLNEPEMGEHVQEYCPNSGELQLRRIARCSRYHEANISLAFRGLLGFHSNLKWGQIDIETVQRRIRSGKLQWMLVEPEGVSLFGRTIDYARDNGVLVVLAYVPSIDVLNESDLTAHDSIVKMLSDYANERDGVFFLDYNSRYQSRHELFYDPIHLNAEGQRVVSREMAEDVKRILDDAHVAEAELQKRAGN